MSDQTPEARLAAALPISVIDHATEHDVVVRGRYTLDASMMRERLVAGMTAADPTLICPDPAAHEGVTFTVDSLAAAMTKVRPYGSNPGAWAKVAAALIIKAAKEASE